MNKPTTIHTSRTLMFAELAKVMDHAIQNDSYLNSLNQNITSKKTKSGIDKTAGYLKTLYSFDISYPPFKVLKYFWQITEEKDRPILALLYAIGRDYLLAESIPVIGGTKLESKVMKEKLEENIEAFYPNRYTENTRKSLARNIVSSWKQSGFITGEVKNIRTQPEISYNIVAFAFLIAYLSGLRGDFILTSKWVKALFINDSTVRELAVEAAKRDLMQYQYAGNVTAVAFNTIINKLEIDGI